MTVFQVRPIKPTLLNIQRVRKSLLDALKAEGKEEAKLLEGTTKYWEGKKPKFEYDVDVGTGDVSLLVGPGGDAEAVEKWQRINDGTKGGRWIYAKKAKALRFQPGYSAGSTPGTLKTKRARRYGPFIYRRAVYIKKGITARDWTSVVLTTRYIPFWNRMDKALRDGLTWGGWD